MSLHFSKIFKYGIIDHFWELLNDWLRLFEIGSLKNLFAINLKFSMDFYSWLLYYLKILTNNRIIYCLHSESFSRYNDLLFLSNLK